MRTHCPTRVAQAIARLAGATLVAVFWASTSQAQSCPSDLSNLLSQVQTPELRDLATTPLDTIVSRSGGIDQAISLTQAAVNHLTTLRAHPGNADDEATIAYINEAYLVEAAELEALQCRKTSN